MKKLLTLAIITVLFTGAATATVGFTETDELPEKFSGGESFKVNTTFENTEGEPVPVIFQLKAYQNGEEITTRAFDLQIENSNVYTAATPPCTFGDVFNRNVCAYHAVPDGEHDTTFRVKSAVNLQPGKYNLTLQLLSLEGEMYLPELFAYWGNPENITRGETTTLTDGNAEADIRPSEPGEESTKEAWAHVKELDNVLQDAPENKEFITGAQVLVNEDLCEKTVLQSGFLGNDTNLTGTASCGNDQEENSQKVETGGGIDTALVIDRSGSMTPSSLCNVYSFLECEDLMTPAREGAKNYVDKTNTEGGDRNSIVAFGADADILQSLTSSKKEAKDAIDAIDAGDSRTDLADGIEKGTESLTQESAGKKVMVVLADGGSNQALRTVKDRAQEARDKDIEVHGIMYGTGADSDEFEAFTDSECEPESAENDDGDNCWFANTDSNDDTADDIYEVLGQVQEQAELDAQYVGNATEDQLFGGDTGKVEANGSIRFSWDRSGYITSTVDVYRWNNGLEGEEPQGWQKLNSSFVSGGKLEADVEKFSTFALFGEKPRNRGNNQGNQPDDDDNSGYRAGGIDVSAPQRIGSTGDGINASDGVSGQNNQETEDSDNNGEINQSEDENSQSGNQNNQDTGSTGQDNQGQQNQNGNQQGQPSQGITGAFASSAGNLIGGLIKAIVGGLSSLF